MSEKAPELIESDGMPELTKELVDRQITNIDSYLSTIVSIVPFEIIEEKPGIYPGVFRIPAAENETPQVLVVGESIYHVEVDEKRSITVKCPSYDVAQAVVDDYAKSNLAYSDRNNSGPGIFWVRGQVTAEEVAMLYPEELANAQERQRNWFLALVQLADDDWEKTRQHKMISDTQRFAARSLEMERPWLIAAQAPVLSTVNCRACQSAISPEAILCPNCKCVLDKAAWQKMEFAKFA